MGEKLADCWSWSGDNVRYCVDNAKSARSSCKEFRCKKKLEKGELRVGIARDECDHGGSSLGWYHPACVFKTMTYRTNANKRISVSDVDGLEGFGTLAGHDQARIRALAAGSPLADDVAEAPGGAGGGQTIAGKVTLRVCGISGAIRLVGNTFAVKDVIKKAGGKWDGGEKCWVVDSESVAAKLLGVSDDKVVDGATFPLSSLMESTAGGKRSAAASTEPAKRKRGTK
eukprot:Hpha_TRINITY_DN19570_c0_g1::TRINITY_DN19570_c0_g1_i1::g.33668::m.33668